jgi:hypothetical protein
MATLIVVEDLAAPASVGRGGLVMYPLQWLHGLQRLGHRVVFLEILRERPEAALVRYFRETVEGWWHPEQSALLLESPLESLCGLGIAEVGMMAQEAAALITLAAHYRRDPYPLLDCIRPRILIEQDPGYTQLWAKDGDPAAIYGEQDFYYTVGGNIGSVRCSLPTLGIRWRPIWNPVILDWWSPPRPIIRDRFTTVADWRSYGYLEYEGAVLGPKAEEFRKFLDLPRLTGQPFEIVLNIDAQDPDLALLRSRGWKIEDPEAVTTPDDYRNYVAGSLGEFSCVKGGYAGTHCGWFSDRSACYLAAGRPVVLQATGFEDLLPTGEGLFAVKTPAEAVEAIRGIRRDYALHSRAAQAIAREYLDADKIHRRLLAEVGIGGTP